MISKLINDRKWWSELTCLSLLSNITYLWVKQISSRVEYMTNIWAEAWHEYKHEVQSKPRVLYHSSSSSNATWLPLVTCSSGPRVSLLLSTEGPFRTEYRTFVRMNIGEWDKHGTVTLWLRSKSADTQATLFILLQYCAHNDISMHIMTACLRKICRGVMHLLISNAF